MIPPRIEPKDADRFRSQSLQTAQPHRTLRECLKEFRRIATRYEKTARAFVFMLRQGRDMGQILHGSASTTQAVRRKREGRVVDLRLRAYGAKRPGAGGGRGRTWEEKNST